MDFLIIIILHVCLSRGLSSVFHTGSAFYIHPPVPYYKVDNE